MGNSEVLIGSILLEKNRWTKDKNPSFLVSDWADRLAEAGLDGIELWEFHGTDNGEEEVERLAASKCPVTLFNTYFCMEDVDTERRHNGNRIIQKLGCRGVKFNVGKNPDDWEMYLRNTRAWREELPADVTLLCECHPGTVIEEPVDAKRFFNALGCDGWEIIVHPFSRLESLQEWLDVFGEKVTHMHLQVPRTEGQSGAFSEQPEVVSEGMGILKAAGYAGSYTLEFTAGMKVEGEGPESLLEYALKDRDVLKQYL